MITRTTLQAELGHKSSFGLKAEVLLLLIITIFGIIGLTFCIGLTESSDAISAHLDHSEDIHLVTYDRQTET